jgi:hypothetical protein
MQNWRGLLTRLLGDTPVTTTLTLLASLITLALVLRLWMGPDRRPWQPGTPAWDRRWAATLFASLLTVPYLITHDLTMALAPLWILAADAVARRSRRLAGWLWLGHIVTLEAIYSLAPGGIPLAPTIYWLILTFGWLVWRELRAPPVRVLPAPSVWQLETVRRREEERNT